jgi:GT2 family glycosyltransferase
MKNRAELYTAPSVTVIIPTKNRASDLGIAVRSLLGQTVLPAQVVIVDQSSDDSSFERVKTEFATAPGVRLDYVRDTLLNGAAAARNRAMESATGEIWLFLDDDVVLEPEFIERLLEAYSDHPEAVGMSGIITNYRPSPLPQRLWSALFARGPFRDERQPIYWAADQLRNGEPHPVRQFTGALMSFRASAIGEMRFDTNHPGALAEDTDFCWRLPAGTQLLLTPRARLVHNRSPNGRPRDHWLRAHAQGFYYLYERNLKHGIRNRICFAWQRRIRHRARRHMPQATLIGRLAGVEGRSVCWQSLC